MTQRLCTKCNQPIAFIKSRNGKFIPTNVDGSDHWDGCKEITNKSYTGDLISIGKTIIGKYAVHTDDTSCPF